MQVRGCGTALITPFHQDGSLDEQSLRNLVAWQIESGIDFLVPCGTTGETPTLSHHEWLRVIDLTIEVAAGRVAIVAGATSNSTHDAVEKAKELASRPGVDAILTASPYYNKPRRKVSTSISKRSQKQRASRSFFTTFRGARQRTLNRSQYRGWTRFRTLSE